MKGYLPSIYSNEIEERELTRTTENSVFFLNSRGKEERELITSNYRHWFLTKEDAIQFLRSIHVNKLKSAQNALKHAEEKVNQFIEKYGE